MTAHRHVLAEILNTPHARVSEIRCIDLCVFVSCSWSNLIHYMAQSEMALTNLTHHNRALSYAVWYAV